ncbi:MAG: dUTP diphosphatase [Cetobacterium sp.]
MKLKYMTKGASGMDVRSTEDLVVKPGETRVISTGIKLIIPTGHEIQVRPRSGLSTKGITVMNSPGTVDEDYRGECKVILSNLSGVDFVISKMDRIAQMVLQAVPKADLLFVSEIEFNSVEESERGANGFGSTGIK